MSNGAITSHGVVLDTVVFPCISLLMEDHENFEERFFVFCRINI